MELVCLDFLLTYRCVSECKHCLYHASPRANGEMNLSDAKKYLDQAKSIKSVVIHGGEPFIYFDILVKITKYARKKDIERIWVMTNGYWARNQQIARERLSNLKDAGCTHILLSADVFHQEFISLERVKTALDAARGLDFPNIIVNSLYVGDEGDDNEYNIKTKKIIQELGSLDDVITKWESCLVGVSISVMGRACETLTPYLTKKDVSEERCTLLPYLGKDLGDPRTFEIDPFGNVLLCPGLSVGNAKEQQLSDIIKTYDPSKIPVLDKLKKGGPKELLKEAVEKGYTPGEYVDVCHLCYEVRKFLRKDYPNLTPDVCYGL
ncbi:MAG: radical SAM protein [Theionarchaea archaeon]|nr:radical SAM protein [Theionarchaea archaeon]